MSIPELGNLVLRYGGKMLGDYIQVTEAIISIKEVCSQYDKWYDSGSRVTNHLHEGALFICSVVTVIIIYICGQLRTKGKSQMLPT